MASYRLTIVGTDASIAFRKALNATENGISKSFKNSKIAEKIKQKWESGEGAAGKFEALAESTLKYKEGRGILLETEDMINSLFSDPSEKSLKVGIKDPKYVYHHRGTVKMPERRVLPTEPDEIKEISETYTDDLAKAIRDSL